jgi:transcriptional regulator with XRE-family HTH domain
MSLPQTRDSWRNSETSAVVVPIHLESTCPLHRLGEARRQEHISRSNVARHLGITVQDVSRQECSTTDLPLSLLHKWAKGLGVPVAELVEEPDASLSKPLSHRAGLVRVMKTALAILERTGDVRTKRLAQTMVEQLIEIMPELRGVTAWHAVGRRRRRNELGLAAVRRLSADVFADIAD